MAETHDAPLLIQPLILLAAAVVAVPLFKRLGLGSVLGYLAAGVVIGPFGLALFSAPERILRVAELGIVFFLFLIGLDLDLGRLRRMSRDIFGLGGVQILATGLMVALYPLLVIGRGPSASLVAGLGLALSSTAFVMQILEENGELQTAHGQKSLAILLMQDLAIVPLLALVAFLSPRAAAHDGNAWLQVLTIVGAIAAVVLVGRYLLDPLFQVLARARAREIMTASALLVVIGAATVMTLVGVSMAMGAFLAGVLLAESTYRHELEADIEPFRGILLGLFFMSVGMTVDLSVIAANWLALLVAVAVLVIVKSGVLYVVMRLFGNSHEVSVRTALPLAQGGEFGFVLFATAVAAGVMTAEHAALLVALVTLSMALTPLTTALVPLLLRPTARAEPDEDFSDADGRVLLIGFGRFGQIAAQLFLARGVPVTIIDRDIDRIEEAGRFGSKVYFGDGMRLDVLRAAGAGEVELIAICTDEAKVTTKIVDLVREQFPQARCFARSYDRRHSLELLGRELDFEMRETLESAIAFGREALVGIGVGSELAHAIADDVRQRDREWLLEQHRAGDLLAGIDKRRVRPEPLRPLQETSKTAADDAADATPAAPVDDP